ncbi:MAG: ABC transporter permease subunit [Candidatus Omnitrophota bacterium]|nr:ABC transporter permease subunit [Candidatus Omnitrophota bacterium]
MTAQSRFQTAASTLFLDRFMTRFIAVGGISVIAAVLGIFLFIAWQTLPLFQGAKIRRASSVALPEGDYAVLGADEWGELPFVVDHAGAISFIDLVGNREVISVYPGRELNKDITAFYYNRIKQEIIYGTSDGHFFITGIHFRPFYEANSRRIDVKTETGPLMRIGLEGVPVERITYGAGNNKMLVAALQTRAGKAVIHTTTLVKEASLFGAGQFITATRFEITQTFSSEPSGILVNSQGDGIVISTAEGKIYYFAESGGKLKLHQVFEPFDDTADREISSMDYLLGEVSVVLTNPQGINRIFSLYVPAGNIERVFGPTKEFRALDGPAAFYSASLRNKAFLIGRDNLASLRYGTTEVVRWEERLPFRIRHAVVGGKYDRLFFLDWENQLHIYMLSDPHPETSYRAFFGKLWYEGYTEPAYEWQSTGGTDDFEQKLSLVPLIIGTLKGTFFAMLFALPMAILGALYTSQFAHPRFKLLVKPMMEIMASLPSVVLGFLAALWLAPLIEARVPSILLMVILILGSSFLFGAFWTSLDMRHRKWIRPGYEWIALIPVLFVASWVGWQLGPLLEKVLFVTTDPNTGLRIADFRLWWPEVTGASFEQRNSLVVGFMMAFAVIPIIFTISEDSLSNVPRALTSGSLALGASRWQTAIGVVLPTAFPGIFSAVMVGLGRAVGETMIVVMATGNTPVMDMNIFSGMRTLSANVAVELPEAPYLGTLYRSLFLGATVLFVMTFTVNTIAEIIRQRLREKYKTV